MAITRLIGRLSTGANRLQLLTQGWVLAMVMAASSAATARIGMALGKGKRHQPGNGGGIDLERVEAQIGLFCLVGEPGGEGFNIEDFA